MSGQGQQGPRFFLASSEPIHVLAAELPSQYPLQKFFAQSAES
jgi:hypothetical protein